MKRRPLEWSTLLISAVGIAYQVALMRVFSIAQWHHFAYMIISVAMLGFGASGAFIAVVRPWLRGREAACLRTAALALTFSLTACYVLSQRVPFETFELVAEPRQLLYLFALYTILAVPFFLVSACVTLAFFLVPKTIGRLYCFTMLGSGFGAAATIGLLYAVPPSALPGVLSVAAALAHLILTRRAQWGFVRGYGVLVLVVGFAAFGPDTPVRVSQYKGLSYARLLPDARIVDQRFSPISVITAVQSAQIRETPGQIANYSTRTFGPLPAQIGLYFDGGAVSAVNRFEDGALQRFTFLDYVTSAAAYRLIEQPRMLVIGAGGGADVLSGLWHRARHVTALDVDPSVLAIMNHTLAAFSGGLYQRPDVTAVLAEGRGFLQARPEEFDLIHLPLFGAFTAAAAGVYALNESYLYTREAFELYLSRLSAQGVLSINCWLKTPPCDAIKLFATAVEACEAAGIRDPARHLVFLRSWNNATILVARSPLTDAQVTAVRGFCDERGFDVCHIPNIQPEETNRFTILERPIYYEASQAILSPGREAFYRAYPFYIRPATDNRPYFFRFVKWTTLPRIFAELGPQWVSFIEWGYLALIASLVQSALAAAAFILLPLIVLARRDTPQGSKRWVFLYFAALGMAYMFLEIAFIQRFMLFLAYPVYAVAVVLTAFLVFSGFGSLFAGATSMPPGRRVGWAVAGVALASALYVLVLPRVFSAAAAWPDWLKIPVSVALLAPMAFCMGIPFPTGLQLVSDRFEALLPWAWGINGCASVIGAILATCAAVHVGFTMVVALAILLYVTAAASVKRLASLR